MCNLFSFFAGAATFSATAYIPLFYQAIIGSSAIRAGSTLMPLSIAWGLASSIGVNLLLKKAGHHRLLVLGFVFMTVAYLILSQIGVGTRTFVLVLSTSIIGMGLGFSAPMILTLIQMSVPRRHLGVATSSAMFFRQLGGAVCVSSLGGVMSRGLIRRLAALGSDPAYSEVAQAISSPRDIIRPEVMDRFSPETVAMLKGMFAVSLVPIFKIAFVVLGAGLIVSIIFLIWSQKDGKSGV
jgi:MFS family permease